MEKIKRFFKEEEGLEMSEYALMGALICLALVTAIGLFKDSIANAFGKMAAILNAA